jgi:hypothetical protein
MAQFPIEYSQSVPGVTRMPRANVNVDSGAGMVGQALSGLGGAMFDVGQKIQLAQDAMQLSDLNRQREESDFAAEQQLKKITDADEAQKFIENHFVQQAGLPGKIKAGGRVAGAYQQSLNNAKTETLRRLTAVSLQARAKDAEDKFKFARESAVNKGDLAAVHKIDSLALSTEIIGEEQFKALSESAPIDVEFASIRKLIDTNPVAAEQRLSNPEFRKTLSPDQLNVADRLGSMARKQQEVSGEEANKQLTDLMANRKLTVSEIQARRDLLPANDYEAWTKIALNPADKKGNVIKATELKSRAIDVWRGTLSRTDAEAKIRESLADPNGINDDQYAAIYADLDREVKGYQAQDIRTYSNSASQLILGKDSGVMQFDALGNMTLNMAALVGDEETFYRKMHFVDLYNAEMNDFLAENPTVSKKDLWLKSQELKQTYVNAARNIGKAGTVKKSIHQPSPEELRKQNTKEAYEQGKKLKYWD